jgi:hypothetical protein
MTQKKTVISGTLFSIWRRLETGGVVVMGHEAPAPALTRR